MLKLKIPGNKPVIINGAMVCFEETTHICFMNHASILRDEMVMQPQTEGATPLRRLYWAIQQAYTASNAKERRDSLSDTATFAARAMNTSNDAQVRQQVGQVLTCIGADDLFPALKSLWTLIEKEDAQANKN